MRQFKAVVVHFRLHWQVQLLPLFLWGFLLSGGTIGARFWSILVLFHVLFYGGATALNSYFDQDRGPIGGLWKPPPADRAVLWVSSAAQIGGLIVLPFLGGWPLFWLALAMGVLALLYSHPAIRLKGRPWASLLAVALGQGIGGTLAGWFCGRTEGALLTKEIIVGSVGASLVVTGFYPLTQIYQRAEDRRRGDITFAVRWGKRCFPFAVTCMALGAVLMAGLIWEVYDRWAAGALAGSVALLIVLIGRWWRRFDDARLRENYLTVMRLGYMMTAGFLLLMGWLLGPAWTAQ